MAVLAIDTSDAISVAVVADDGAALASINSAETRQHAEQLAVLIQAAVADAGLSMSDVAAVVVGTGPGPFTGLRVGIVTARTLGLALGTPVWGVPSHDVLAAQAISAQSLPPGAELLIVTDARRKEVYWSRYRVTDDPLEPLLLAGPGVVKPAILAAELAPHDGAVMVGKGVSLYQQVWVDAGLIVPDQPTASQLDATVLAQIAIARAERGLAQPTEPLYLRRPDIHGTPARNIPPNVGDATAPDMATTIGSGNESTP